MTKRLAITTDENGARVWAWESAAWAAYMKPKPVFPPAAAWGRVESVSIGGRVAFRGRR